MREASANQTIYRKDYTAPAYQVDSVQLRFDIGNEATRVETIMHLRRDASVSADSIELDGKDMNLVSLAVDGKTLQDGDYTVDEGGLKIHQTPDRCVVNTVVEIKPHENTALEGLYQSGDFLLTQCEAEGFRKITYFPDRPDVMTRYSVTLVADKNRYPVLLSNGNAVDAGDLDDGRHWVRWDDPFPKPSYLFALVAGDLGYVEDHFTTRSGREVLLRVYVEHENLDRCEHAMASLINSMRWDEERFDLEYDLDIYNIVATNDFNMGAMENKSLNIFNSKYVLARPDTATDTDYQGIEGVIGHEYFHNWTGNRVTCRDWFQLTLKEGLTVFRDQEFSSDMQSHAVKRIQDVRDLRNRQFPEDAGPMAHPIRPDKYIEINNFYTVTVYEKGAAIIRMYHTLLGEEGFQKGMKLYFERHDGQAVTCDDFLAAMADANDRDLERFGHWYSQSGTPDVYIEAEYDPDAQRLILDLRQETKPTPDQDTKQPLLIPFAMGLLNSTGAEMAVQLAGEDQATEGTRLLLLEEQQQRFELVNVSEKPVLSLFRGFSAPVKIHYPYSGDELATLIAHDTDAFARWEAAQKFALDTILAQVGQSENVLDPQLVSAFRGLLTDKDADPALIAEALMLPSEDYLADQMDVVDVDGIHQARQFVKQGLASALADEFAQGYQRFNDGAVYSKSPSAMARRSLKNVCLSYLSELSQGLDLARGQLQSSDNMTDTLAALKALVFNRAEGAEQALVDFEKQWKDDALVMDKWFAIQAMTPGSATVYQVEALMNHSAFSLKNPNKVRSLIGAFSMGNPTGFHSADGRGYRFHADQIIALNALNPQIAARMAGAFNRWKRYDDDRQALMKSELQRIQASGNLSPDVYEIVSNALK